MALPLPRTVADVGPGGGLVTAMGGINALENALHTTRFNKVKADWANTTIPAQAYSQLAYANAVAPQMLAKLMANPGAMANMTDEQKVQMLNLIRNSGLKTPEGTLNSLGQMPQKQSNDGTGHPATNTFSGYVKNALQGLLGKNQQQPSNPFANPAPQYNPTLGQAGTGMNLELTGGHNPAPTQNQSASDNGMTPTQDAVNAHNQMANDPKLQAFHEWLNSPEGQKEIAKGAQGHVPNEQEVLDWQRNKHTYEENAGHYQGIIKEGEELGDVRAKTIDDISRQQLNLSSTGANLERIINDINDPKFMDLRKDFPLFQDMQLKALSKVGSPEQQEMIGNFIADVKSFAGSTVNSFKGQTMKREFDYADQLKPSEGDTVNTARGKLTALKSLKEIAERKNDIILNLMQNKHMNLGDAVKQANKKINVKDIDKQVKELTQPMITVKNKKTGESIRVSLKKARELGVPNV